MVLDQIFMFEFSLAISLYLESKNDLLWFFSLSDASLYGPSCFLRFFCGGAPLRILFSSQYAFRHCHINSIKKERWMLWQSIQNFKIETGYKNLWLTNDRFPTFSSHFLPTTWISFTKLKFRRSFWGAEWVCILICSKVMTQNAIFLPHLRFVS